MLGPIICSLVVIVILIAVAVVVVVLALTRRFPVERPPIGMAPLPPFRKRDYLLSMAERSFFEVLLHTLGTDFHVFAKVRMEDIVYLPKGTQNRQAWINKVRQKHVDFLLCDRQKASSVLVIELDDASHERDDVRGRDEQKDAILRAAGLPILRVPARRAYDTRELREAVDRKLGGNGTASKRKL